MVNITYASETGIITEDNLDYNIAWYEDLGEGFIHLGLIREGSTVIKCYQAGNCSVNDVGIETLPSLLAALGNPEIFVPDNPGQYTFE
jgi:hypothetical protein